MGNWEAGHAGSFLGCGFPALYPPENAGLGYEGLRGVQGCSTSRGCVCPGACAPRLAEPFPCEPGTEQCLFRLWEKRPCKQQSVDVATSPLKIASLYLFSYPLCFHHLLPPTLIAPMPELLFLPGCCRHRLKQTSAEAARECPMQSWAPGEGGPVP